MEISHLEKCVMDELVLQFGTFGIVFMTVYDSYLLVVLVRYGVELALFDRLIFSCCSSFLLLVVCIS